MIIKMIKTKQNNCKQKTECSKNEIKIKEKTNRTEMKWNEKWELKKIDNLKYHI